MPNNRGTRALFGSLRTLPSGRIQARYTGPDGRTHTAPITFTTKGDAETWLSTVRADMARGLWQQVPKAGTGHSGDYAESWLKRRNIKPRTRALYRGLLDRLILPTFKTETMAAITPRMVSEWWHELDPKKPTQRAHAYQLMTAIMATAVTEDEIPATPCRVRGGGQAKRVKQISAGQSRGTGDTRKGHARTPTGDGAARCLVRLEVRRTHRAAAKRPRPNERHHPSATRSRPRRWPRRRQHSEVRGGHTRRCDSSAPARHAPQAPRYTCSNRPRRVAFPRG